MGNNIDGSSKHTIKPNSFLSQLSFLSTRHDGKVYQSLDQKLYIVKCCNLEQNKLYQEIKQKSLKMQGTKMINFTNVVEVLQNINREFCSVSYSIKVVQEYYQHSLLNQFIRRKQAYPISQFYSNVEIIQLYQFMLDTLTQYKKHGLIPRVFNLNHIKVTSSHKLYKYTNPISHFLVDSTFNGEFFAPENFGLKFSEPQIVFSMGMVLLSACCLDDLQECYNYKNCNFGWSFLEGKLINLNRLSQQLIEGICMMLQKSPHQRPTLQQCNEFFKSILKNIQIQDYSLGRNILTDISINTITSKSRSKQSYKYF